MDFGPTVTAQQPMPQPAALQPSLRNVIQQRLTIFTLASITSY